jgi:glycerophosphoryl diester phosphodiesterase
MAGRDAVSIIAHRGYSALHRENSPTAWQAAAACGADLVEVDIRFTADGHCVCIHDPDLRLARSDRLVHETPFAVIERLEVAGEPVAPAFQQALDAVPVTTGLLLDVKDERPVSLEALANLVGQAGDRQIVLGLHDVGSVAAMRQMAHREILGFLNRDADEVAFVAAGGSLIRVWEHYASADRVASLLQRGLPVWVTTGGDGTKRAVGDHDPAVLKKLAAIGVSGFLVNDPVAARNHLNG